MLIVQVVVIQYCSRQRLGHAPCKSSKAIYHTSIIQKKRSRSKRAMKLKTNACELARPLPRIKRTAHNTCELCERDNCRERASRKQAGTFCKMGSGGAKLEDETNKICPMFMLFDEMDILAQTETTAARFCRNPFPKTLNHNNSHTEIYRASHNYSHCAACDALRASSRSFCKSTVPSEAFVFFLSLCFFLRR